MLFLLFLLPDTVFFKILKGVIFAAVILRFYLKFTTGWCKSRASLKGKTAIVTGGNAGIGYETALDFAQRGARTIIACRNEERAEEARKKIVVTTGRDVIVKIVDFASFESVTQFAKDINETEDRLDILVNNAGIVGEENKKTKDGLQTTMQINYFGPFLVTNLLLDLLKKTPESRIVNVSSVLAKFAGDLDVNELTNFPGRRKMYAISKLCNILFTIELAKKLKGTGVTTNSLHPGVVQTDILRTLPQRTKVIMKALGKLFFKTPNAGAQTTIYVAVDEDVKNVSGEHFADCKQVKRYKTAEDPDLPEKLWKATEKVIELHAKKYQ